MLAIRAMKFEEKTGIIPIITDQLLAELQPLPSL
jgi:hypothetical protein